MSNKPTTQWILDPNTTHHVSKLDEYEVKPPVVWFINMFGKFDASSKDQNFFLARSITGNPSQTFALGIVEKVEEYEVVDYTFTSAIRNISSGRLIAAFYYNRKQPQVRQLAQELCDKLNGVVK